ncbi:MAG: GvpL/GvpF family gas vesicle protein [Ktedonobacteraceae bacterium]
MSNGFYIYGLVRSSEPQEFGDIGIGNPASPVLTVGFQDIWAVVSDSPFVVYDSLAKEKTIKDLVTHQFVIEKVMEHFTIVPVKFGTMVENADEVIAFLEKGYPLLSNELSRMEQKIEMDVVARWDMSKILAALPRHHLPVQEKQQEIALKGDRASVEDKIALGKVIEQALQTEKARYQQLILRALKAGAADARLHNLASDEMIFNAGFLVEKKDEHSFTGAIDALDRDLEDAVNFRVVGPLPAYSFATILLERIDPRKLAAAKKLFGLNGEITAQAVRDTYHQLAQQCHPDKRGAADALDFHLVHSAYRTLKDFTEKGLLHVGMYQWENDV